MSRHRGRPGKIRRSDQSEGVLKAGAGLEIRDAGAETRIVLQAGGPGEKQVTCEEKGAGVLVGDLDGDTIVFQVTELGGELGGILFGTVFKKGGPGPGPVAEPGAVFVANLDEPIRP